MDADAAAARIRAAPAEAAVVTDFDGTLAPIVADPADAHALPGAVDALHRLSKRYRRVAVVSGRPVGFLRDRLGLKDRVAENLVVSGLYGLERLDGATLWQHPAAASWSRVVAEAADRAETSAPAGVGVERKGLSVTLHVRTSPSTEDWARSWAAATAATSGLVVHRGRMSYELRPPAEVDKGTVVTDLVSGCRAACFLGDDVGDLPAFDALDRLAATEGATVVRLAVRSDEAPLELLERADIVVHGPAGALSFLESLL